MEFKGTKGEWYYEQDMEYPNLHNIWSKKDESLFSQGVFIARTCFAPSSERNALLISKAPEMLEMLIKLKDTLAEGKGIVYDDYVKLDNLIKEATEI